MNKFFLTLLFLSLSNTELFSQDLTKDFDIISPSYKVQNSLYKKIDFLDSRDDNTQIGIVGVGLLKDIDAKLIFKTPFSTQLTNIFNSLIDSTARDGEMLFQLKQFSFIEKSGTRYCYFNAATYLKNDDRYDRITSIDTTILVTAANITKALIQEGSNVITGFIANGLLQKPSDPVFYTIHEIENIDSVEKQKIPVYNTTKYVDGIYTSYASFSKQVPDLQGFVEVRKDGTISSVKTIDSTGKKVKIKPGNIYAVINNGQHFIATEYGYYPLLKLDDDFIFTGDIRIVASSGDMRSAQFILGITGALLAKAGNKETFELKIDYTNGTFIHLKAIPPPEE
jgi:hypothetical protein